MWIEALEMNKEPLAAGETPVGNGKGTDDVEKNMSKGSDATSKPVGGRQLPKGGMSADDQTASTLAAASEKLQAAQSRDQNERRKGNGGCLGVLSPKRLLSKLRDLYVNTCIMASEKGDLADMVAGHTGLYYGETVISRQMSERRDQDRDKILQASLSKQVSSSLSRQYSQQQSPSGQVNMTRDISTGISGLNRQRSTATPAMKRQTSAGIPGLNRQTSTRMAGLNHQASSRITGLNRLSSTGRNSSGKSVASRKQSNLFSAGREQFLQQHATDFTTPKAGQLTKKVSSVPENDVKVDAPHTVVMADETKNPVQ